MRWLIAIGLVLCGLSLYEMTTFNLDVSESQIIWNGVYLGFGLGLVFPPLTTLAFATIPQRLRTEGAAINALLRNLGASIGIAVLVSFLARNTQENRAGLAEALTPFNANTLLGTTPTIAAPQMLAIWDGEINRQAATIGYLNDFRAMMICTLVVIPLLFFMQRQATLPRPSRR